MKLKPVVASLFALGLASAPVLAVAHTAQQMPANNADMAKLEAIIAHNNANAGMPYMSYMNWLKRIHFSGMINVDGKYTNRGPLAIVPVFQGDQGNATDINVNNANLFVDADVNKYVKAHVGLAYVADSVNTNDFFPVNTNTQDKNSVFNSNSRLGVDEAYVTLSDFQQYPFFARFGKMYTPFGSYSNPYPISYSLTQLLTQTRATTAEVGFVHNLNLFNMGSGVLNASLFTFSGGQSSQRFTNGQTYTKLDNYGAKIGYCSNAYDVAYSVNVSYIKDIRDTDFLNDVAAQINGSSNVGLNWRRAGAVSANARLALENYPIVIDGGYVSALRNVVNGGSDTQIWAGDIGGTYGFRTLNHNSNVGVSYQSSGEAAGLLPKWRIQGDYAVNLMKHTMLTLLAQYNRDYGNGKTVSFDPIQVPQATGKSNTLLAARLGVKF